MCNHPITTLIPLCLMRVLSHAGEKSLFDMKSGLLTWVPLTALSPDAQDVQEKYLAPIQARIDAADCPPGLRKQYKLQLEHINARIPSHEIIMLSSSGFSFGERDSP